MLNCCACGKPLSIDILEGGHKYVGMCSVCGLEHVLFKKDRFLEGDEVCSVTEVNLESKFTAKVLSISKPICPWGNGWFPMSYRVLFEPGAYGKPDSSEVTMTELQLARVKK